MGKTAIAILFLLAAIMIVLFAMFLAVGIWVLNASGFSWAAGLMAWLTGIIGGFLAKFLLVVILLFLAMYLTYLMVDKLLKKENVQWWQWAGGAGLSLVCLILALSWLPTLSIPFFGIVNAPTAMAIVGSPSADAGTAGSTITVSGSLAILFYGIVIGAAFVVLAGVGYSKWGQKTLSWLNE